MSKRDCGKWYCQKAQFRYIHFDTGVRIYPYTVADDNNRQELDREREKVKQWMYAQREVGGYKGWLAGPGHEDGAAQHYWVWDPDSRGMYMEFRGPFYPNQLPANFGALHRGMGWQLPLLAVFHSEPSERDIITMKKNNVAYTILQEEVPDVDPPVVDDDAKEELLSDFDHEYTIATSNTARLGILYEMLYRLLDEVLP